MFVRNFLPRVPQPDTDGIENLSMAVIVDQKRLGGGSHSTMGTITDISPILRLLFSRVGQPHIGQAHMFSFNDPQGMCPECNGIGRKLGVNMKKALDMSKSLNEGAIMLPDYSVNSWEWNMIVQAGPFDPDKKLSDYPDEELEQLLFGKAKKVQVDFAGKAMNITVEGVIEKFTNKYI
jgi:excinuclease UvrABC ATPase subunit